MLFGSCACLMAHLAGRMAYTLPTALRGSSPKTNTLVPRTALRGGDLFKFFSRQGRYKGAAAAADSRFSSQQPVPDQLRACATAHCNQLSSSLAERLKWHCMHTFRRHILTGTGLLLPFAGLNATRYVLAFIPQQAVVTPMVATHQAVVPFKPGSATAAVCRTECSS